MMGLSAAARRQRLLRKFHLSGEEGAWTRPFEDFPEDVRESLLRMASVQGDELPVLSYFRDSESWVLLTTERLVTWKPQGVLQVRWSEIESATVDAAYAGGVLTKSPAGKLALQRLKLLLQGGGSVELELEAGAAFFGFWNALKLVATPREA